MTDRQAQRRALLELDGILARIETIAADTDRATFDRSDTMRWVLHRLWIAVGNEALAYTRTAQLDERADQPWARLYQLRNKLAHRRLPDIDEHEVWRITALRPASIRGVVRDLLR